MDNLLRRTEIIDEIAELKNGSKNFWYWAMKAKVEPVKEIREGGNITYLYSPDAVEKIKAALGVK